MVQIEGNTVRFRFFRRRARCVQIMGDFNGWGREELRMWPCGDGYWTATICLRPGTYKFRYRADGQWFTDYAAFGVEYGPMGVYSVVCVAGGAEAAAPGRAA